MIFSQKGLSLSSETLINNNKNNKNQEVKCFMTETAGPLRLFLAVFLIHVKCVYLYKFKLIAIYLYFQEKQQLDAKKFSI